MKHKKILAVLLGVMLILTFTACGSGSGDAADSGSSKTATAENGSSGSASAESGTSDATDKTSPENKSQNEEYGTLLKAMKEAKFYEGTLTTGFVGTIMKNSFFTWKVNSVKTETKLNGKSAGAGKKFVVASVSVKNTTDEAFETGNYDFIGYVELSEDGFLDTKDSFYDKMYPDETELAAGKTLTGDIVFLVDEDVNEIVMDYTEFYGDESIGNTNWVDLKF